ncbi:MAG TPA: acyltransferase [Mycobacteriales bacterium]|nr:acyltransferase [Mycobacteriales bacterium]
MRRSRAVDALRGVAVLLVLMHHLDTGGWVDATPWLAPLREVRAVGFLGVSLFLVLSGFSIHLRVAAGGEFRAGQFLLRRFLRLHPAYLVAVCLALCLIGLNGVVRHSSAHATWGFTGSPMPVWMLACVHLTVVGATVLPAGWLMVTWSLALEEHLYLIYAGAMRWLRRTRPLTWLLVGLGITLAWRAGAMLVMPSVPKSLLPLGPERTWVATLLYQQAPARIVEWLLGAVAAEWYVGRQRLPQALTSRVTALLSLYGVWWLFHHRAGFGSLGGHPVALTDLVWDPAAGAAFFLLLCSCLAAERRTAERGAAERGQAGRPPRWWRPRSWPLRSWRPTVPGLAWVGERSYSLYLVHLPIFQTTFSLLRGTMPAPAGRIVEAVIALVVAFGCAALMYRYVEAPSTAWSKRAGQRPAPPPSTARPEDGGAAGSDQRYAAASATR